MYSDEFNSKYLHTLNLIVNNFTQKELAFHFDCSMKTINSFMQGKLIRFDLLEQYAAINGYDLQFNIYENNVKTRQ